jgi:Cu(I)/Ag(I) efflux system membrane fusion protein
MNTLSKTILGVAIGALLGASAVWLLSSSNEQGATANGGERKPLYWVAPMDPNYQRDEPGKSPMGMDLIPVYADGAGNDEVGTVKISPEVINNLGVRTARVESGRLDLDVKTVGYVQYDEDRLTHMHPRVEGWIEKLYVKSVGDPVTQGKPLYALYSPTLVNAQEELLLALKRGNALLISAAVERLLSLQVPRADIERLRKTRKVNQTITVAAPRSGVVDNLTVREGMYVKPGMNMMSIGQLEHIWVIGEVFERQVDRVREGDKVRMWLDYLPGREWQGEVNYIYPSLNEKTRTAQVRVYFDNPDAFLKPGMFAQMIIETRPGDKALLIPREALIRTGSQSRVVLALGDGQFKSLAVKIGRVGEDQVEIRSGLNEGERIVTSAQFLIDSESSKTSDFKRMAPRGSQGEKSSAAGADAGPRSVWVGAQINELMPGHRMVTLEHEAIADWQWPAMTMDFTVDEGVDMDALKAGMRLHVQISRDSDGNYQLTQVHIPDQESADDAMPAEMDHSQRDGMNHDAVLMLEQNDPNGMRSDSPQQEHQHD